MANNINWGKIYESTAWGSGVDNNTIGWGDSYADLAGGGPKNTIAPVISGTAERGETLTSTTGTWTGTGTITYAYQWKRDGADISGATASTYVLVAADDNANMTCVVSATDTEGTKSATSNTLGPVLAAPLNLTSPVASGTAQVGQTLSTTDGTWQGIATITFAYQWRRDAVNISGATSSTYTLVAADYTTDIDCVVTATNGLGSASADSNDIANIAGTAPSISGVPTISSQTQVGETITATAASVTGVPTPTTTLQWQRSDNGTSGWANISGATSSTYTLVSADDTKYVRAVQTSTNAVGSDSANSAASAQISEVTTDPNYQAVLDRASTLGYTAPSAAQQELQNTLVEDLKTAGVWSKLDVFYVFATDGDSDYATLNWKSPSSFQATKVNSPTFTSDIGFTGDGTSAYLNTNFTPSTDGVEYTLSDASEMFYRENNASTPTSFITGNDSATRGNFLREDNNRRIWFNSGRSSTNADGTGAGFFMITKSTDATATHYKGTSTTTLSLPSPYALSNGAVLCLTADTNVGFSSSTLQFFALGADLNTEASNFKDALDTYIAAL